MIKIWDFFANFLGIFILVWVIAYHYAMADPKYEETHARDTSIVESK
ncbi:hypothetical protein MUK42_02020 [Musa troglodytarum]|uniref:Dolichyl-diphosphooligosaccharide--protein glycosyltransferase subunit 4A n=1 Tax=Musa troglodytarum TaxID=320322 RepID=A0A9E7FYP1_9LILI|nr:hypothetical protein MUK42_02020 [Musa troglodytarum]